MTAVIIIASFIESDIEGEKSQINVFNNRISAIIQSMKTMDFTYIEKNSTFVLRFKLTINSIKQLPEYVLFGRGLGKNQVPVTYVQGNKTKTKKISVHNAILSTWMQVGILGIAPYIIFLCGIMSSLFIKGS